MDMGEGMSRLFKAVVLMTLTVTFFLCGAGVSNCEDSNTVENITKIIENFSKMKKGNRLPGLRDSDKGGQLVAYRINSIDEKQDQIPVEVETKVFNGCTDLYVINVMYRSRELKYFFCLSSNEKFLSAYEKKNKWTRIDQIQR